MKLPHVHAAIFVGVMAGFLGSELYEAWTEERARPPMGTPSPQPDVTPTPPAPGPEPSPEPEETPRGEVTPPPTTPPATPSRPAVRFPPTMPACTTSNPESLYEDAFAALDSGEVARTEALFEELAVCRGEYALAIGSLYDPALQLSGNLIEHDPRKALHFYIYAAALGKRAEVLQRLSALHELARSDSDLEREIGDLLEALGRPQR